MCVFMVFEALGVGVAIEVNHRAILDGNFGIVTVPESLVRAINLAVDNLDNLTCEEVKKEIEEKELDAEVADKVGAYVVSLEERSFGETLKFLRPDTLLS
jgi:histidyl-tRNA synthetase